MNAHGLARGHTKRHIQQVLAERSLRPHSSLGQCFLVDLNLLDILLAHADLRLDDFILEIGAGTGSLTRRLAERAGRVVSVEIDRGLFELARETIADCGNVRLLCADVLRGKNQLNPAVMAAVSEPAPERLPIQRKLVANLPYVVATPVITLLLMLDLAWDRFVVTVQKELADRLVASPGTRDYGSLSVLVQALADVELVRELPPSVFWPRPNVASAIVVIRPSAAKRAVIRDLVQFSRFVRGVLLHRRKNLRGAMSILLSEIPKAQIDGFLRGLKIDPHVRAESLTVAQFIRLADALPEHWRALPARSG